MGGGVGIGCVYCLVFVCVGVFVVVNDFVNFDDVVNEIKVMGGKVVGVKYFVEDGDVVVKVVIDIFGCIDIVINNVGIFCDKVFINMDDNFWDLVMNVYVCGIYKVIKVVWFYFFKQKYGCVVNIIFISGIYGNFGQVNYVVVVSFFVECQMV